MKQKNICIAIVFVCSFLSHIYAEKNPIIKESVTATPVNTFLNSIGANSAVYGRGENLTKTMESCQYIGIRWIRMDNANQAEIIKKLYTQSGIKVSCSVGSLNTNNNFNLDDFISNVKLIAGTGALLAIEGCNEPNNWALKYDNQTGGSMKNTWMPVAKLQRDLYKAVKEDPILKNVPVWSLCENGAQFDNSGLQYLTIPNGAGTLMPDGTKYADYACCHNYFVHPNFPAIQNNQTWKSSDPSSDCPVDGLYGNYGLTWSKKFAGYSEAELKTLPRVTTETGVTIGGEITEEIQGLMYMSTYLSQYKRGWSYTAMYILRDRVDEDGNQTFGFYRPDDSPRPAAIYLHNLTTILTDDKTNKSQGKLAYAITDQPETVHDLLLQKSNGKFELVIWGERFKGGSDNIKVNFNKTFKKIKIYNPIVGTEAVETLSNVRSVSLTMSNHPYVIEIEK